MIPGKKRPGQFLFSILTAVAVGAVLAFAGIEGMRFVTQKKVDTAIVAQGVSEEEDPTFVSHFSRAFIYSSHDEKVSISDLPSDIIESSKKNITAVSYIVTDIDRDIVSMKKDPDRLLPIASITKLATAVVARRLIDPDDVIDLKIGSLKAKELLYPMLMISSNEAAVAFAGHYDSIHGRGMFVKEMNNWASSIGAYRTYFRDPSGISPNNLSTANDISLMVKWIRRNDPVILDITLTKVKSIRSHTWVNPTHFLNLSEYVGGKNGYTPEANRTSVSLFSLGEPKRVYSVVLLGSSQRDADTLLILNEVTK